MGFGRDLGAALTFGLSSTTRQKEAEAKHENRRQQHQRRLTSYNEVQEQIRSGLETMDAHFTAAQEVLLSTGALTSDPDNNVTYGWYRPHDGVEDIENTPDYTRSAIGTIPAFGLGIGTPATIWTLVGIYGTAATGTAIGALSGAAAGAATAAWIGRAATFGMGGMTAGRIALGPIGVAASLLTLPIGAAIAGAVDGEEDDRHVGDFADLLHQLHAVAARKHQVQQDQTGLFLRHEPGDLLRVSGYDRRVARLRERVPDVPERLRVVVHAENAGRIRFLSRPWPGPSGADAPGLLDRRNGEGEPASQARPVALGLDAAPVGLHDPLADGQAQAGPAELPSPLLAVEPRELPEQVRQPLGGHARAVVGHREGDVDAVPHHGHPDEGELVGMPGRVGQQVVQHLHDAPPVRQDPGQVRRQVDLQTAPVAPALEPAPGLVHQDARLHGSGAVPQYPPSAPKVRSETKGCTKRRNPAP